MIPRDLTPYAKEAAKHFPAVAVTGPRQSGKTTFCKATFPGRAYVSLETPDERDFALRDPRGFLARYPDGAILDEIQRAPDLVSYLQGFVDDDPRPGRWILTGSQHFLLARSISQSLAGRLAWLELLPLGWNELQRFPSAPRELDTVLFTGSYPRIHDRNVPVEDWMREYVALYVERDVREILSVGDLSAFRTFAKQAAGRSAQILNLASLGADVGVSQPTARSWLSVLETSYLVFRLRPLVRNLRKRLAKSSKLHFVDSGLLCHLLDIRSAEQIASHPLRGAIFETWVVSEVMKAQAHRGQRPSLAFYRDQRTEVDVVIERPNELVAAEIKSGRTIAPDFLRGLDALARAYASAGDSTKVRKVVVYGGDETQTRSEAQFLAWRDIASGPWTGA